MIGPAMRPRHYGEVCVGGCAIHPSAWNRDSRMFISKILHSPASIPLQSPLQALPFGRAPVPLVTPMYRYAQFRILP